MIVTEQLTINYKLFTKNYSDSGYYIECDGVHYSEAIDPAELGRTYTETKVPIVEETQTEIEQKAEAWDELVGGGDNE